jgi:hypothetical protein
MTALINEKHISIEHVEALARSSLRAEEPSHIHIPRPSRVMRLTAGAAHHERSDTRESAYASGIGEG